MSRWRCLLVLCLCVQFAPGGALASSGKPADKLNATPDLSAEELAAVERLFARLSEAFRAGDAEKCMRLFASNLGMRERIETNLKSEFEQSAYSRFDIVEVSPEDKIRPGVHSVEVRLRLELFRRDRPREMQTPIRNATSEIFTIRRVDNGEFVLLHSLFFENLGKSQRMGLVAEGLLAVIALCALLAFWVWMGWEAWRARPYQRAWRVLVMIPIAGPALYFAIGYLPRQLRGKA